MKFRNIVIIFKFDVFDIPNSTSHMILLSQTWVCKDIMVIGCEINMSRDQKIRQAFFSESKSCYFVPNTNHDTYFAYLNS